MISTFLALFLENILCGVIVSMLSSSVVERAFKPRWDQTKNYKIGMFSLSDMHGALRSGIRIIFLSGAKCLTELAL